MNCISLKEQKGENEMRRGFSLIELMIVIAVMAILIGIALPQFRGMQEEGLIAQAKAELRTLQTAVESYYIHNGSSYPLTSTTWQTTYLEGASPIIVREALIDPFSPSGAEYQLVYSSNREYYAIYSVGTSGTAVVTPVSNAGDVTESDDTCIYVSNGEDDNDS